MRSRPLRGALAGAVATVAMTLEQPLDERLFDSKYDDVAILGKLVTRGDGWRPIGFVLHVQNGAFLGAAYARLKPSIPGSALRRGLQLALVEHVATWPMTVLVDRYHPARKEFPKLAGNPRAFGQATIRHAVYGVVLGLLEDALDGRNAAWAGPRREMKPTGRTPACRGFGRRTESARLLGLKTRRAPSKYSELDG